MTLSSLNTLNSHPTRVPPAIVIEFPVEAIRPFVYSTALNEAEDSRLRHWLDSHPELATLVEGAVRLRDAA